MKLRLLLCAKDFSVDQSTNAVSVWGIWEDLNFPSFPVLVSPFSIMAVFERGDDEPEKQEAQLKVKVAGQEILSQGLSVSFQDKPRSRILVQLNALPVMVPGNLDVVIRKNNTTLGTYTIKASRVGPIEAKTKGESFQGTPNTSTTGARSPTADKRRGHKKAD